MLYTLPPYFLQRSRYQSLGFSKSRAWDPALGAGSLLGRWFLGVSLGRGTATEGHTHGWVSSWMMGPSPTGDPLRNCMESTQDWPACVMRHVAPELLMSLHFHILLPVGGIPQMLGRPPARKKMQVLEMGHCPLRLQNSDGPLGFRVRHKQHQHRLYRNRGSTKSVVLWNKLFYLRCK